MKHKRDITKKQIEGLLRRALKDGIILCYNCRKGNLEPDYDICRLCKFENPLVKYGYI